MTNNSHLIARRTEQVPIYQGDDAAAIESLRRDFNRLVDAEVGPPTRLNDASPVREAAAARDAAIAEALPRAVMVTLRALGRKAYRHLKAEHPPREGDEGDAALGFNQDSFLDALLEYFDAGEKSVVEPDFATRESLVDWLNDLNDGNFTQLAEAAVRVNEGGSPDPKGSLTWQLERLSAGTSMSPASTE